MVCVLVCVHEHVMSMYALRDTEERVKKGKNNKVNAAKCKQLVNMDKGYTGLAN